MGQRLQPAAGDVELPIPLAALVDQTSDRFERDFRAGGQPRIEEYLSELPDSAKALGLRQLLAVELELRRAAGQTLDADDFRGRFPEFLPSWKTSCGKPCLARCRRTRWSPRV